jgi:hypothetical protein
LGFVICSSGGNCVVSCCAALLAARLVSGGMISIPESPQMHGEMDYLSCIFMLASCILLAFEFANENQPLNASKCRRLHQALY